VYFRDSGPAELHASLQSLGAHAVGKNDDGSRWQLACDDGRTLDIQVIDDFDRYSIELHASVLFDLYDEHERLPTTAVSLVWQSPESDQRAGSILRNLAERHGGFVASDGGDKAL
jgi:hypothetical protein